jgi:putative hydrolase of the HAD superfamily
VSAGLPWSCCGSWSSPAPALGLPPHECVFVDDAPDLVAAAIELGYGGTAIVRGSDPPTTVPWIGTLEDLVPMTAT